LAIFYIFWIPARPWRIRVLQEFKNCGNLKNLKTEKRVRTRFSRLENDCNRFFALKPPIYVDLRSFRVGVIISERWNTCDGLEDVFKVFRYAQSIFRIKIPLIGDFWKNCLKNFHQKMPKYGFLAHPVQMYHF